MPSSDSNQSEGFQKEKNNCTSVNIEEIVYDESSDQQSESMDLDQQSGANLAIQANSSCPVRKNFENTASIQNSLDPANLVALNNNDEIKSIHKNEKLTSQVVTEETQPASRFRRARIRETIEQWSAHRIVAHDSRVKSVPTYVHDLHKQTNPLHEKLKFALDRRLYCYFCMKVDSFDLACKSMTDACTKCLVKLGTLEALQDAVNIHRQWLIQASNSISSQCENPNDSSKPAILDQHEKLFEKWIHGERRDARTFQHGTKIDRITDGELTLQRGIGRLDLLAYSLMKEFNYQTSQDIIKDSDYNVLKKVAEYDRSSIFFANTYGGYPHQKTDSMTMNNYEIIDQGSQYIKYYPYNDEESLNTGGQRLNQIGAVDETSIGPYPNVVETQMTLRPMAQHKLQQSEQIPVPSHLIHHQYHHPQFHSHHSHQFNHTKMIQQFNKLTRIPKNSYNQVKDGPSDELLMTSSTIPNIKGETNKLVMKNAMYPDYAMNPQSHLHHQNAIQYSMDNIESVYNHNGSSLSVDVEPQKIFTNSDQNYHHPINNVPKQRNFLPAHVIDFESSAPPTSPAVINGTVNNTKGPIKISKTQSKILHHHIDSSKQGISSPSNTPQHLDENDPSNSGNQIYQQNLPSSMRGTLSYHHSSQQQIQQQPMSTMSTLNGEVKKIGNSQLQEILPPGSGVNGNGPSNMLVSSLQTRTNSLPMHPNIVANQLKNISLINGPNGPHPHNIGGIYQDASAYDAYLLSSGVQLQSSIFAPGVQMMTTNPSSLPPSSRDHTAYRVTSSSASGIGQAQQQIIYSQPTSSSKSNRFSVTTANTHSNPSMESSVYNNERPTEKISNSQPGEQVDFNHSPHQQLQQAQQAQMKPAQSTPASMLPGTSTASQTHTTSSHVSTKTTTSTTSVTSTSVSQQNLNDQLHQKFSKINHTSGNAYKKMNPILTGTNPSYVYQQQTAVSQGVLPIITPRNPQKLQQQQALQQVTSNQIYSTGEMAMLVDSNHQPNNHLVHNYPLHHTHLTKITQQGQPIIVPMSSSSYQQHPKKFQSQSSQQQQQQSYAKSSNDMNSLSLKMYGQLEGKLNAYMDSIKRELLKDCEDEISRVYAELNSVKESYNELNSRLIDANKIISDYQRIIADICKNYGINYQELMNPFYRQQKQQNLTQTLTDPSNVYQQMIMAKIHTGHSTPSSSNTSNPPLQTKSQSSNNNQSNNTTHMGTNNQQTFPQVTKNPSLGENAIPVNSLASVNVSQTKPVIANSVVVSNSANCSQHQSPPPQVSTCNQVISNVPNHTERTSGTNQVIIQNTSTNGGSKSAS